VYREPIYCIANLIENMRNDGRRMRFIGLSNTLLDDRHGRIIARALNSLSRWPLAPGQEPETLDMHRMVFQHVTRQSLLAEARLAGVNLLLSHPNGPALRGF
jgi:hypothetical protein